MRDWVSSNLKSRKKSPCGKQALSTKWRCQWNILVVNATLWSSRTKAYIYSMIHLRLFTGRHRLTIQYDWFLITENKCKNQVLHRDRDGRRKLREKSSKFSAFPNLPSVWWSMLSHDPFLFLNIDKTKHNEKQALFRKSHFLFCASGLCLLLKRSHIFCNVSTCPFLYIYTAYVTYIFKYMQNKPAYFQVILTWDTWGENFTIFLYY